MTEEDSADPIPSQIKRILSCCAQTVRELDIGHGVERIPIHKTWTGLDFINKVGLNVPFVLSQGRLDNWPAFQLWNTDYLKATAGDAMVTVALTPNGLADAVTPLPDGSGDCFVLPYEEKMSLSSFLDILLVSDASSAPSVVPYLQFQNSSLTEELPMLLGDIEESIPWVKEALSQEPQAINIWIGGSNSTTSFHKDHYENLYTVITGGTKTFYLCPPNEVYRMKLKEYPVARYAYSDDGVLEPRVLPQQEHVHWPSVSIESQGVDPIEVTLHPGELLYLPSMWYHAVRHEGPQVIAVNYWYDMHFGSRFAMHQAFQELCRLAS